MEKAITSVAPAFKGHVNFGDDLSNDTETVSVMNYATTKEVGHPEMGRGLFNLMNRVHSSCIRLLTSVLPSMMRREHYKGEKTSINCDNMAMADMVCVAFDNEESTQAGYYQKVDGIAESLGISRSQLFLINFAFFLLHVKLNGLLKDSPLPVMCASSYSYTHWFGNAPPYWLDDTPSSNNRTLFCGNIWHPEFWWCHFTKSATDDLLKWMCKILSCFYSHNSEVGISPENAETNVAFRWDRICPTKIENN